MIFIRGPLKYYQEAGLIQKAPGLIMELGKNVLIVMAQDSLDALQDSLDVLTGGICAQGGNCAVEFLAGDTTYAEIDRVAQVAKEAGAQILCGFGGGRANDVARGAADQTGAGFVSIPTIASSDSPCSAQAVIRDENGRTVDVHIYKRNPEMVLVDTRIIANAPSFFLSAGIGDAFATYYETRANIEKALKEGTGITPYRAPMAVAEVCKDVLLQYGAIAIEDVKQKKATPAVEEVVHAAVYYSGYGFENADVAIAHGVNDGFFAIGRGSRLLHGNQVAFGLLVQLETENVSEGERDMVRRFFRSVDLPVSFAYFGLGDITDDEIRKLAEAACGSPAVRNMPFAVTPDLLFEAIKSADAKGREMQ